MQLRGGKEKVFCYSSLITENTNRVGLPASHPAPEALVMNSALPVPIVSITQRQGNVRASQKGWQGLELFALALGKREETKFFHSLGMKG